MDFPQFQHDCNKCVFLGRHESHKTQKPLDLYVCAREGVIDTVIARYGNDGPEYSSGLIFATRGIIPELVEALNRAKKRGFKVERFQS